MSKMRQFGNVRKLASGKYQARYWSLGRQVAAPTTFKTKADANAWLSAVETDQRRGEHIDPQAGSQRFGPYARDWLDARDLRARTRETYASQLKWILEGFENARLREITPATVRAWYGRLTKAELAPNTVAKVYRMFRTIMGTAVDDGLLRVNPVAIKGAAREEVHEQTLPSYGDVANLADAIEPRFHALVWLAATSGLRYGELTGLARRHVDLDNARVRVERALTTVKGKGAVLGEPKSAASHRTVVIPVSTTEVLRSHLAEFTEPGGDSLVFTSVKGRPLLYAYFKPYWKRAKADAGVDPTLRFHSLRHLASTTAMSAGASMKEIMGRNGQSTHAAALRYQRWSSKRDAEIAAAMDVRIAAERAPMMSSRRRPPPNPETRLFLSQIL